MASLCFVDTNIFIYSQDGRDKRKQKIATRLLRSLAEQGNGAISTQVMQEYCNAALKPGIAMPEAEIRTALMMVLYPILRHTPSLEFYQRALELREENSVSFYDALIVQAAVDLGCKILYSEDLQDGRSYGELVIKNPFKASLSS